MTRPDPQQLFSTAQALSSIGRYGLRKVLGTGASGTVYAGFDPETGRDVAINLMLAGRKADAVDALLYEARTWASLDHPHLLHVHEVGTYVDPRDPTRRGVYVVRDIVSGMDMQRWLDALAQPVTISPSQLLGMFLDAGGALAAAHDAGLVHGGFSPASILVGYDGHVTINDFASRYAKPMGDTDQFTAVAYSAPEVHEGARHSRMSDQYSFCAALSTSLDRIKPGKAPKRIQAILDRGMSADPTERWPSLEALLSALGRTRHGLLRRTLGAFSGAATLSIVTAAWQLWG